MGIFTQNGEAYIRTRKCSACSCRKVSHLVPFWQDMEVLQSINSALSPLSSLTDILSGETYVTVSAVLPMLQLIESSILKEKDDDTQLTKDLKNSCYNRPLKSLPGFQ